MSIFDILMAWSVQLVPAATLLAVPEITNRDVLFGVPVPRGFRTAERGRSALRTYRITVAGTAAGWAPRIAGVPDGPVHNSIDGGDCIGRCGGVRGAISAVEVSFH